MAMWHCPHCGTPQAETARCWVCRRSSTTCSTCRHFRESLATDLGYCGLDRRRVPLTGRELRGCWAEGSRGGPSLPVGEAPGDAIAGGGHRRASAGSSGGGPLDRPDPMRLRGFVPIEELAAPVALQPASSEPDLRATVSLALDGREPGWAGRVTLFGDGET